MKKSFYVFAIIVFFCTSCNEIQQSDKFSEDIKKQNVTSNNVVIVRVNHGKKVGKWPNQKCDGDQLFRCWRWFPKDKLTNAVDPYEFENYMIMEYAKVEQSASRLVLRVPQNHEITQHHLELYDYVGSCGGIYIDEAIVIDEPEALDFLHSVSPVVIVPKFYGAIQEFDSFVIPIELGKYYGTN